MRPEGHLVTAAGVAAAVYVGTGSAELAAGVFTGGFLIDLDHYVDYVLLERQWSPNPLRFLDYYLNQKMKYMVLLLHSYELLAALSVLTYLTKNVALLGYVVGAIMHITLDIRYNDTLREPLRVYSFLYRYSVGFKASEMVLIPSPESPPPVQLWK